MFNLLIATIGLIGVISIQAAFYTEDKAVLKTIWADYKIKWAKTYATVQEEALRFNIFVDKLQMIDKRNSLELQAGGTAVHGLTQFSDITNQEFRSKYLTTIIKPAISEADSVEITRPVDMSSDLVDWTGIYTT